MNASGRCSLGAAVCAALLACMSPDQAAVDIGRRTEGIRGEDRCLLEYNTALVEDGEDPCCRRENQSNQCNTKIACNERSGGGCCVIYGTMYTEGGQGCCLYEGQEFGTTGDGSDRERECRRLLTE